MALPQINSYDYTCHDIYMIPNLDLVIISSDWNDLDRASTKITVSCQYKDAILLVLEILFWI